MNVICKNGFLIIKAAKIKSDKPFEVIQNSNHYSEVVASADDEYKPGDVVLVNENHGSFNEDGTDYVVIRATDIVGVKQ
jgi:co-chaperonin GroES (HSP10)